MSHRMSAKKRAPVEQDNPKTWIYSDTWEWVRYGRDQYKARRVLEPAHQARRKKQIRVQWESNQRLHWAQESDFMGVIDVHQGRTLRSAQKPEASRAQQEPTKRRRAASVVSPASSPARKRPKSPPPTQDAKKSAVPEQQRDDESESTWDIGRAQSGEPTQANPLGRAKKDNDSADDESFCEIVENPHRTTAKEEDESFCEIIDRPYPDFIHRSHDNDDVSALTQPHCFRKMDRDFARGKPGCILKRINRGECSMAE